jgi:Small Multidrug Resistance protein
MNEGIGWGWILLAFAILLELAGTTSMKLSAGFTKLWPSILMFLFTRNRRSLTSDGWAFFIIIYRVAAHATSGRLIPDHFLPW